jgi:hypothetical protein
MLSQTAVVVFAYNRPTHLKHTLRSLQRSFKLARDLFPRSLRPEVFIAIDGPKGSARERQLNQEVADVALEYFPNASLIRQTQNRGLPVHLLESLDWIFDRSPAEQLICVEDDVDLAETAVAALLVKAGGYRNAPHVISASPVHADGSLEHQMLILNMEAHSNSRPLLKEYISTFSLDGALRVGAYGNRSHREIELWLRAASNPTGLVFSNGTSQDRIRERAWRLSGTHMAGLPFRLVKHRGWWGQHNTPWYALRTGQMFQRLDKRPWAQLAQDLRVEMGR